MSDRSGRTEIWIAAADGTSPIQLTSLSGEQAGSPYWSPDGQTIVFDWSAAGTKQIYAIPVSGGRPLPITNSSSGCVIPRYSRDGKWIYFASEQTGRFEVVLWTQADQFGSDLMMIENFR